jgi:hypothetical protein
MIHAVCFMVPVVTAFQIIDAVLRCAKSASPTDSVIRGEPSFPRGEDEGSQSRITDRMTSRYLG